MSYRNVAGFTLIETLITTVVLVGGLTAVAGLFSYSAKTNIQNQQRTTATVLLYDKLEQLKTTVLGSEEWEAGAYSDEVTINNTPYVRKWQISTAVPREATVTVYVRRIGSRTQYTELARATMMTGPVF